jgi:hypothetical protein
MDSEFNKTIQAIKNKVGQNIVDDIASGKIKNLPDNFELVLDFPIEAYRIKKNTDKHQ